jgi:hypothetical protein
MWLKKARRKVKKARNMLSPTYHIKQHARRRRHFQRQDFERRWTLQTGSPQDRPKRRRRRKLTRRIRALQSLVAWHYLNLALSLSGSLLTLFVVVNVATLWRGTLLLLVCIQIIIGLYLLISGLSSK